MVQSKLPYTTGAVSPPTFTKWLLACSILLNFSGLFVTIMGPDGALYAQISKTMVQTNNYLELFSEGKDWLDKPHFPFWITALSFKIFGINTWAYKLPALLFSLLAARYTYLFTKKFYNDEVALWATIIFLTAEHIIISNNDVRAEPYLTALIIGSTYHFSKIIHQTNYVDLLIGSLLAACAIMTKGIFALVPIGGAIIGGVLLWGQWRKLFHVRWLLAGLCIALFITPELYCLWYQFDNHPEKVVFDQTQVSGIRFFFWDSQFGRFMNTGPIRGQGDPSFFLHTILWAFLPWSLLFYAAIIRKIKNRRLTSQTDTRTEWFAFFGAALTILLFSFSRFQLPHYTNIIFTFCAVLTAHYLLGTASAKTIKVITRVQLFIIVVMLLLAGIIHYFFFASNPVGLLLIYCLCALLYWFLYQHNRMTTIGKIASATAVTVIALNLYLNFFFYPALLHYQLGSEAAFYLNSSRYNNQPVVVYTSVGHPDMEFYLHGKLSLLSEEAVRSGSFGGANLLLIAREDISKMPVPYTYIHSFEGYPVSRLSWPFVNRATRPTEVKEFWLIKL